MTVGLDASVQIVEVTLAAARGEMSREALAIWIRERSRETE